MMDSYTTSRGTTDSNFIWDVGSNYYAKKYDNGVMELYGKYTGNMTTTNPWASCYYQVITEIVFPISFTDMPIVTPVLSRENSGNVFNLAMNLTTSTGFKFYPVSMNGTVTNVPYSVSYTAIGHWK